MWGSRQRSEGDVSMLLENVCYKMFVRGVRYIYIFSYVHIHMEYMVSPKTNEQSFRPEVRNKDNLFDTVDLFESVFYWGYWKNDNKTYHIHVLKCNMFSFRCEERNPEFRISNFWETVESCVICKMFSIRFP